MINELFSNFAATALTCPGSGFFGMPTWYEYLPCNAKSVGSACLLPCTPSIANLTDAWLIVAAIIEILLRIAALFAIVFVIYGGVLYATSQGDPDKTSQAKNTLVNALVGVAIAVVAATVVAFIAGSFK